MDQIVQVGASLLILAAFVLSLRGRLDQGSLTYLALNAAGSGVLAVLAAHEQQWGFLLLEGVWFLVSAWGLVARARGVRAPVQH